MIQTIKIILCFIIFAIFVVAVAGFVKFNIIQDDIYITQKDGSIVRVIDLEEYVFTTQDGITGVFAYISKDKSRATLDIKGEFHQLKSVVSGSGAKYANEDETVIFWEHQGGAWILLNNNTYATSKLEQVEPVGF